jgi:hypothetical protein
MREVSAFAGSNHDTDGDYDCEVIIEHPEEDSDDEEEDDDDHRHDADNVTGFQPPSHQMHPQHLNQQHQGVLPISIKSEQEESIEDSIRWRTVFPHLRYRRESG